MEMIENLEISNYKSIKQIDLHCSRINIFVGEPNTGKSNILEALDLSYLSSFFNQNEANEKAGYEKINIKEYFRVKEVNDFFHLGNVSSPVSITHNNFSYNTFLSFNTNDDKNTFKLETSKGSVTEFDKDFIPVKSAQFFGSPIKPFRFKDNIQFHDTGNYIHNLMPPYGNNLLKIIQHNASFQETIKDLTEDYGLEINIDTSTNQLYLQVRINRGLVYSIPYSAIADTFKRILFYLAAVRYSRASVITLDEPDAHSFPRYVSYLGDEIIKASNRQFFIATHNPYLLNNLIENTPASELSVFVCGYDKKSSQTRAKKLSQENLSELLDYGVDIFFNVNRYLDDSIEYSA